MAITGIKTKHRHLERGRLGHGLPTDVRIDKAMQSCANIILRLHSDLKHVERCDCRDDDEHRDVRRVLAQATWDHKEAHRWRDRSPPTNHEQFMEHMQATRQARINGEPPKYERINANINRRRAAEGIA